VKYNIFNNFSIKKIYKKEKTINTFFSYTILPNDTSSDISKEIWEDFDQRSTQLENLKKIYSCLEIDNENWKEKRIFEIKIDQRLVEDMLFY
jgi:hypothetical protein